MGYVFCVRPRLEREVHRCLDVKSTVPGEQADYSCSGFSLELPLLKAYDEADHRKVVVKAKPGDVLLLVPKVEFVVRKRIVIGEANHKLYKCGIPVFKRMHRDGDKVTGEIHWTCTTPLDLSTLPWMLEYYIFDESIRGAARDRTA